MSLMKNAKNVPSFYPNKFVPRCLGHSDDCGVARTRYPITFVPSAPSPPATGIAGGKATHQGSLLPGSLFMKEQVR